MSSYYDDAVGVLAGRRSLLLAGVAVAVLAVTFLLGHSLGGGRAAATPPNTPAATVTATVTAAPNGTVTPAPSSASVAGRLRKNSTGVFVGYTHDQAGAIAAAGNYVSALYTQQARSPERERAILTAICASPEDATRIAGDFSGEDRALAQLLGVTDLQQPGVIAFGRPLGYRVDTAAVAQVVVDVHVAGGQGMAGAPEDSNLTPRGFVEVNRLQLVWAGGDWKLRNWSRLVNGGPEIGSLAAQAYVPFPMGEAT